MVGVVEISANSKLLIVTVLKSIEVAPVKSTAPVNAGLLFDVASVIPYPASVVGLPVIEANDCAGTEVK